MPHRLFIIAEIVRRFTERQVHADLLRHLEAGKFQRPTHASNELAILGTDPPTSHDVVVTTGEQRRLLDRPQEVATRLSKPPGLRQSVTEQLQGNRIVALRLEHATQDLLSLSIASLNEQRPRHRQPAQGRFRRSRGRPPKHFTGRDRVTGIAEQIRRPIDRFG